MKKNKYIIISAIFLMFSNVSAVRGEISTITAVSPAAQVLIAKLYSPDEKNRVNAALKLADYNNPQVVDALIASVTRDSDEMVKRVALRSLGYIGSETALPVILSAIKSESYGVKIEAMGAAVNFSSYAVVSAVAGQITSPNPLVRQKAAVCLSNLKNSHNVDIIGLLESLLSDISEGVRVAACQGLGRKKSGRAISSLSAVLFNDRSELVRRYAAEALGDIGDRKSEEFLKKALDDDSPSVRITAAKSLAVLGSTAGLNEAIEAINSQDAWTRVYSCEIIGTIGNKSSVILLESAARDIDQRVQNAAASALKQIESRIDKKNYLK